MGVVARARDRLAEGRTTLATPAQWMRDALIGPLTGTGQSVGPERALTNGAVFACVSLIAETIAQLPWPVYRHRPRGRERLPGHPLHGLLNDAPNPEMSAFEFREALTGHLETWGNAYAEIEFDAGMRPIALWPLRPDRMAVERIATRQDRRLRYTYTTPSGRQFILPTERVLHWRGLSADGLIGYSRIGLLREAVGLGLALEQYASRFFGNDSRPGGVLQTADELSDDARKRLKAQWESAHQGLSNVNRVAVLEQGVTWQSVGLPPQDAQFIEARKFQTGEIARIFRVPPHMIGDTEKSTSWGSGIEQQQIAFVQFTLMSRLVRVEQATDRVLLGQAERARGVYTKHTVEGLLRGDSRSRAAYLHQKLMDGALSQDEWRALDDENPLTGGQGTHYWMPVNMQPIDLALNPPEPEPVALPAGDDEPEPEPEPDAQRAEVREVRAALPPPAPILRSYACQKCKQLLFRSADASGSIETVCRDPKCRLWQVVAVGAGAPVGAAQ